MARLTKVQVLHREINGFYYNMHYHSNIYASS